MVLERAPRCRLQVTGVHRRVRARPFRHSPFRRPVGRRRRHRDHLPEHHRGDQPSRVQPPADVGRRRRHDGRRTPRQSPPVGPSESPSVRRVLIRRHLRRRRRHCGARRGPRPKLLAITGASNVTGWMPPIDDIVLAAHERGIPVFLDAAQLAPHRALPAAVDFVAWSGHKMYAPFGAGALVGPRHAFVDGDPFLAGGGAVDLVDLDEVVWTDPPEREEAGSPNVLGAIALHAAIDEFDRIGWSQIEQHDAEMADRLRSASRRFPASDCSARIWQRRPCRSQPSPSMACIMRSSRRA